MALTHLHKLVACSVRQGDVIIHWHDPDPANPRQYPLHVAIYIGPDGPRQGPSPAGLPIRGLPRMRNTPHASDDEKYLGDACTGEKGGWFANMIGQRLDVDDYRVLDVALLSQEALAEQSQLPVRCEWNETMRTDPSRLLRGALPLFVTGTCAHYVEWLYEGAGLDLVNQSELRDPQDPGRLHPSLQIHAFWTGAYPLSTPWDDRFRRYPDCLFGPPTFTR